MTSALILLPFLTVTQHESGTPKTKILVIDTIFCHCSLRGCRGCDRMVVGFTTTYVISAITTDVVSSNLDQGEVYNSM